MNPLRCFYYHIDCGIGYIVEDQAGRPWDLADTSSQHSVPPKVLQFYLMSSLGGNTSRFITNIEKARRALSISKKRPRRFYPLKGGAIYAAVQRNAWRFVTPMGQYKETNGAIIMLDIKTWHR